MAKEKTATQKTINPGDLCDQLQEYRNSAGYTLDQMAEALCLAVEILASLENERFDEIPAAPYVRGYLRNYAKLAGRDSTPLINTFESLRDADPKELNSLLKKPSHSITPSNSSLLPILAQLFFFTLLIAVVIGISKIPDVNKWIIDTWDNFSVQSSMQQEARSADKPLLTGTMPIPTPLLDETDKESEPLLATTQTNPPSVETENNTATTQPEKVIPDIETSSELEIDTSTIVKTEETISEMIKSVSNNDIIESLNQEIQTTTSPTPPLASENKPMEASAFNDKINIKLVFNKEVWVRIRGKDQKTLFEGVSYKGDEKILDLNKPLTFRVGNAQGLTLFVDNKAVDIKNFIKGSIANFTLQQ